MKTFIAVAVVLALAGGYMLGINGPTLELVELNPETPTRTPRPTATPGQRGDDPDVLCRRMIAAAQFGEVISMADFMSYEDYADILRDCITRLD